MNLVPSTAEAGLWVNPRWQEGDAGTFAMVIGVSDYTYLNGSAESFNLTPLEVSALTAYRFFEWLARQHHIEGCPLARCWLLLAPTEAEEAVEPALKAHALGATFAECETAIVSWAAGMAELLPRAARASRGVFFFSGHGFEMTRGNQLLLPSDYLRPPGHNWNKAIGTTNLTNGLASSGVPLQLFFVDACRNAPAGLTRKKVTGVDILPEDDNQSAPPDYLAPVLYATSSGQRAFQQPAPRDGLSLFGQALLDGVAGKPDLVLAHSPTARQVRLYPLHIFAKARVVKELVRSSLTGHAVFDGPRAQWVNDFAKTHDVFGSESGSHIWMSGLELVGMSDGRAVADPNAVAVGRVEHDGSAAGRPGYWRVELTIQHTDPSGHCLGMTDSGGTTLTTVLPAVTQAGQTSVQLEFELERHAHSDRALTRVEASPAGRRRLSVDFWRMYRFGSLDTTVMALRTFLKTRSSDLHQAPFSALIGGLIALRLGKVGLAYQFGLAARSGLPESHARPSRDTPSWKADWVALMAACKTRHYDPAGDAPPKANIGLLMAGSGIPRTTIGLLAARSAVLTLLRGANRMTEDRVVRLQRVARRLATASDALVGDGMFTTYVHLTPTEVAALLRPEEMALRPPLQPAMEYDLDLQRRRLDDPPTMKTFTS